MNLMPTNLSEESIEAAMRWYKLRQGKISKYLKGSHIRAIKENLGGTNGLTILAILNSLKRLGSDYDKLEEQHVFWLSLVRACIEEKSPVKRWEKAKSTIARAITDFCKNDPVNTIYEIINDSPILNRMITKRPTPFSDIMPRGSFVDMMLRTVIFFNAMDIKIQSGVFISYNMEGRQS